MWLLNVHQASTSAAPLLLYFHVLPLFLTCRAEYALCGTTHISETMHEVKKKERKMDLLSLFASDNVKCINCQKEKERVTHLKR